MKEHDPVLCYVDGNWAYFTTQRLEDQWGDDWGDTPYEHNAGEPYEFGAHDRAAGNAPWDIVKVAWDGDLTAPCAGALNSMWSVQRINAGSVPWLITPMWVPGPGVHIFAGTPLSTFREKVRAAGGYVYESPEYSPLVRAAKAFATNENAYVGPTAKKYGVRVYHLRREIISRYGERAMTYRVGRRKRRRYGHHKNSKARKAVELHQTTDMSQKEIAEKLGVTRQAVNLAINTARRAAQ
jgi:hypothetical protein